MSHLGGAYNGRRDEDETTEKLCADIAFTTIKKAGSKEVKFVGITV